MASISLNGLASAFSDFLGAFEATSFFGVIAQIANLFDGCVGIRDLGTSPAGRNDEIKADVAKSKNDMKKISSNRSPKDWRIASRSLKA